MKMNMRFDDIFDEHIVKAIDIEIQRGVALAHYRGFEQLEEDLTAMREEFHKHYGHLLK